MDIDPKITAADLAPALPRLFQAAAGKVHAIDRAWDPRKRPHLGAPVFTVAGKYTARGWTEWTQGFQYGCALLVFDGTGQREFYDLGRQRTLDHMLPHVTHVGVHDHGFNNLSTYGNLRRLIREQRVSAEGMEEQLYATAIRCSGAVQAARWTEAADNYGFIYSFNGPHSLFIDTLRTLRVLALAHQLGHVFMGEGDRKVSLLKRLVTHGLTSAIFNIYYGHRRDSYDTADQRGRTAHEAVFNRNDGHFRCPNSQQGYSPFSTWTRGLAWAILGFAEQIEYLNTLSAREFADAGLPPKKRVLHAFQEAAAATADFYVDRAAASDGVCYWDTGAPGLSRMGEWRGRPANPFNDFEPVDVSASAIAAQGLIRLGNHLAGIGRSGKRYYRAGLTIAKTLFGEPYLSLDPRHQGLLLHCVYHRPNGWDYIPKGSLIPRGESCMWGDYHLLELAVLVQRLGKKGRYLTFFDA